MATTVTSKTQHTALVAQANTQQPSPTLSKRGHIRSASLENTNTLISKNTLGLPQVQPSHTGTLKSRNEQKRIRNKFGSHSNLEDFVQNGRNKFNNIRQMFELTKTSVKSNFNNLSSTTLDANNTEHQMQSLPPMMTQSLTTATMKHSSQGQKPRTAATYQQQQQQAQPQTQTLTSVRKSITPTATVTPTTGCGSIGSRSSITELNERLNITECLEANNCNSNSTMNNSNQMRLQQQHQQQQQQQHQHQHQQRLQTHTDLVHNTNQQQQQQQHQQQQQRSASDLSSHIQPIDENPEQYQQQQQQQQQQQATAITTATPATTTTTNLLRPIAFKPIPFEPDYTIPQRYCDVVTAAHVHSSTTHNVGDRYGSTPSLAAVQGSNMRFGSTTDLRHGGGGVGVGIGAFISSGSGSGCVGGGSSNISNGSSGIGIGIGVGGSNVGSGGFVGGYSSNNYCNSLMARRRGSRSLKINDSMESIRHTPDSDINSQSGTIKSNGSMCSISGSGNTMMSNSMTMGPSSITSSNKYCLANDQCDMTPSPSDSGISELEAALKDRDSELSYLRQTMEHNEKDKESYWESETKRFKLYYEAQQREYMLKIKKMEQMLAMQQFQFKQHKLRHHEQTQKLREQLAELKNEYEILKTNNISIKNSERNLKDRSAYVEEQLEESQNTICRLKAQLEESEWKVCERNGELALLKTQLKEANNELTLKEHAIVHLKHENTNAETQIYQSLQENHKMSQQHRQEEQQKAQSQKETETELKQLNKIVILKDQVILALTNELAKLRIELSDLAIFHEYGEEPSGKYTRLKQQLDNLTDICNKTRKHTQQRIDNHKSGEKQDTEKVIDDCNLEVIMNCLKIAPPLDGDQSPLDHHARDELELNKLNADKRLTKMSTEIQNFVYGTQNLPDVAINIKALNHKLSSAKLEESTLDTLIEESASYAEEIAKLRKQLDDVRVNFELEKRQWSDEKEKVLNYQKQLQTHYINMYQKLRNLEKSNEV